MSLRTQKRTTLKYACLVAVLFIQSSGSKNKITAEEINIFLRIIKQFLPFKSSDLGFEKFFNCFFRKDF